MKKNKSKIWEFFKPTWLKIGILIFLIISVVLGMFGLSYFVNDITSLTSSRPSVFFLSGPLEQFGEWLSEHDSLSNIRYYIFIPIALLYYYIYSCIIAGIVIILSNKLVKIDKKMATKKTIYRHLYYFFRPTTAKIIPFLVLITFSFIITAIFRYFEPVTLLFTLFHYLKFPDRLTITLSITFAIIFYYVLCCLIVFIIKYWKNKSKKR